MKKAIVFLTILSSAMALALIWTVYWDRTVAKLLGSELSNFSNRVVELEIKLNHQERLAGVWKSHCVDCTNSLNQRVAELAQLYGVLNQVKADQQATQERLATTITERQQCEGRVRELQAHINDLESLREQAEQNARSLKKQLESLSCRHNEAVLSFLQAQTEVEQLRASLTNASLLRARLKSLTSTKPLAQPKPLATSLLPKPPPPLELLPDGTVRVSY